MERPKKEYGGFLPLELPEEKSFYYAKYKYVLQFNTVKAAIPLLQKKLNTDTVYVPYYLCPNVISELKKSFRNVCFFNIDSSLLPKIDDTSNKLIYLVNYFGIMDNHIRKYIKKNKKAIFILDNAHSFYFKPIMQNNVYNLYSCKKFFGVPDGGYLISKEYVAENPDTIFSNEYSNYLIKSLEEGTNSCYAEKKVVDDRINSEYSGISIFTKKLLYGLDYNSIKQMRKRNFKILDKAFSHINKIKCEKSSVPYLYPLFIDINIKKTLIEHKIYVPTLWGQCLEQNQEFEKELAENTVFLPLDQRYKKEDMKYIVCLVKQYVGD